MILAIDPGSDKTGVAIYDSDSGRVLNHQIVATAKLNEFVENMDREFGFTMVLLGDGTHSREFEKRFVKVLPNVPIKLIDEAFSTLEARKLYFRLRPPRGLKRLFPLSLQTPAEPVDDLVAIILLQRYLGDMPKIGR